MLSFLLPHSLCPALSGRTLRRGERTNERTYVRRSLRHRRRHRRRLCHCRRRRRSPTNAAVAVALPQQHPKLFPSIPKGSKRCRILCPISLLALPSHLCLVLARLPLLPLSQQRAVSRLTVSVSSSSSSFCCAALFLFQVVAVVVVVVVDVVVAVVASVAVVVVVAVAVVVVIVVVVVGTAACAAAVSVSAAHTWPTLLLSCCCRWLCDCSEPTTTSSLSPFLPLFLHLLSPSSLYVWRTSVPQTNT